MPNTAFTFVIIILAIALCVYIGRKTHEIPIRRAGRKGEELVTDIIESVLRPGDRLLTNVKLEFDDKEAECDNIIVNQYGVFIIEVKNYVGKLYGDEDDFEWTKRKTTDAGNVYEKEVKNPIRQVKRQTHILAKYLDYYGCDVWVEGRAYLVNNNSPVISPYMLRSVKDIDNLLHTPNKNKLSAKNIEKICKLLKD